MKTITFLYSALILGLVSLLSLSAEEEELSSEEERLGSVELRSIFSLAGEIRFSLHDPVLDRSFWLEPGQVRHDYEIVEYDVQEGRLVLALGDFEREVGLATSRVSTLEEETEEESSAAANEGGEENDNQRGGRRGRRMSDEDREELQRLGGVLQEAREASPRVEELHGNFVEMMGDFRRVRRDARELDRDSESFRELMEIRQNLVEEFRELNQVARDEISTIDSLSAEDREQLGERLHQVVWYQAREERRAARSSD
ncbi:MAG: hypothetical protein JJT75_01860 [Opitutales bacterium]|nr:hypothetical protein [Opitutales bacterium]MCH8540629.1 hypothetical protein [Opitutales bacterium]